MGRGDLSLLVLILACLACEPVFAIGWEELAFVFVLLAVLLGPPLYRFFRRLENFRRHQRDKHLDDK